MHSRCIPLSFQAFFQRFPHPEKDALDLALRTAEAAADFGHTVVIPVAAQENAALLFRIASQEVGNDLPQFLRLYFPVHTALAGQALLHLLRQFAEIRLPFQAIVPPARIDRCMLEDPEQKFEEVTPRFVRRDAVPGFQIGVVLALFRHPVILQDPVGGLPEPGTVFFLRLPDGGLIP